MQGYFLQEVLKHFIGKRTLVVNAMRKKKLLTVKLFENYNYLLLVDTPGYVATYFIVNAFVGSENHYNYLQQQVSKSLLSKSQHIFSFSFEV